MRPILELFFRGMIRRRTTRYLRDIVTAPVHASREQTTRVLANFRRSAGSQVPIGRTAWGEAVAVPLMDMLAAHSVITGGTGAGKTRFALLLIKNLIEMLPHVHTGFGILDPKGELFLGTIRLLWQRLYALEKADPDGAWKLWNRIVILDFSSRDPVSSYNILAPWRTAETDFFSTSRADLLLDLLPSGDGLSLGASALLRKSVLLLSEFGLPITWLDDVLHDGGLRARLLDCSQNDDVRAYFARQFASTPKQTVAALSRRTDSLFSSESVRVALSGTTAPDFSLLQDEGKIVLVNCFGENISRGVRQLLQALVLSDIAQSVFARQSRDRCFPWFCDEAQNFFLTQRLREQMHDLLTMSRSFGSFMCCLTQNLGAAVQDPRLLHSLSSNVRWSFSMRGEPSDCAFLKSALPITGRKLQPQTDPFKEPTVYSLNDERAMEFNSIASLPDRTGYFWFRPHSGEAIKITTADLTLPTGKEVNRSVQSLLNDATFGSRVSRKEYERQIAERNRMWREELPGTDLEETLASSYHRLRGVES